MSRGKAQSAHEQELQPADERGKGEEGGRSNRIREGMARITERPGNEIGKGKVAEKYVSVILVQIIQPWWYGKLTANLQQRPIQNGT